MVAGRPDASRHNASRPIYLRVLFEVALLPLSFPTIQVTFLHGLHLVDTPRALDEAHRLLKPHGKLVAAWNDRCGFAWKLCGCMVSAVACALCCAWPVRSLQQAGARVEWSGWCGCGLLGVAHLFVTSLRKPCLVGCLTSKPCPACFASEALLPMLPVQPCRWRLTKPACPARCRNQTDPFIVHPVGLAVRISPAC